MKSKDTSRWVLSYSVLSPLIERACQTLIQKPARLSVLRAVLAEVTNASKTSNPIQTDVGLLSLLRKRAASSRAAAAEFSAANRPDLQEKENAQVKVLDEYASEVKVMSEEDVKTAIAQVSNQLKDQGTQPTLPSVMKLLVGSEGSLAGKPVDKASLATLVKGSFDWESSKPLGKIEGQ